MEKVLIQLRWKTPGQESKVQAQFLVTDLPDGIVPGDTISFVLDSWRWTFKVLTRIWRQDRLLTYECDLGLIFDRHTEKLSKLKVGEDGDIDLFPDQKW
ncbi:MAG: hypothetical protein JWP09_139 [Candidatus Taylorbacteria bacterium]|nr:hypothetical protein [Candidatus Taylorbacteria bacterium]